MRATARELESKGVRNGKIVVTGLYFLLLDTLLDFNTTLFIAYLFIMKNLVVRMTEWSGRLKVRGLDGFNAGRI